MTIRTLDVRGLDHAMTQERILPAVDRLAAGEQLRLIFGFNPVPLTERLKARNLFALSVREEGPNEWVVHIERTAPLDDRNA
jgi:uncharacterized protein (DUF2249 family)